MERMAGIVCPGLSDFESHYKSDNDSKPTCSDAEPTAQHSDEATTTNGDTTMNGETTMNGDATMNGDTDNDHGAPARDLTVNDYLDSLDRDKAVVERVTLRCDFGLLRICVVAAPLLSR
jgi:hypothetical protein